MATPPTFILDNEATAGWGTDPATGLTTAAFNSAVGDVWITGGIGADHTGTITAPSNTGTAQTFTARGSVTTTDYTYTALWSTVVANILTSQTVSVTVGGSVLAGMNCVRFSGSNGIGAAPAGEAETDNTAPSLSITTTGDNSAIVVFIGDWDAIDGASRTWRTVNSITPTAGNGFELTYFRDSLNYTVYVAYYPDAGAAGSKTVGLTAPTTGKMTIAAVEVLGTASAASIPFNPQLQTWRRDYGEAYWLQDDRREALLVSTAANPVNPPLDSAWQAGGKYWHLYNDWGSRRFYPQQRQYESPPGLLSTALLEDALLGGADDIARHRAWYTDRREVPQQRLQLADQGAVAATGTDPTQSGGYGPEWRRWRRDPIPPVQRALESPPGLLDTALLEDALLGGATTGLRYFLPVTHADRREYPQQTLQESAYGLLDQALLEVPPPLATPFAATHWRTIWQRTAQILYDQSSSAAAPDFDPTLAGYTQGWRWRRDWQMPVQRAALADQSSTPSPAVDFDPTQAGYTQNWRWYRTWLLPAQRQNFTDQSTVANDANPILLAYLKQQTERTWPVDRREYPQQRQYFAALAQILENELLGGADDLNRHRTWYVSRRLVPTQYDYRSVPGALGALLENELLGGADDLIRHRTWYVDRREVPQQRSYLQEPPRAADPLLIFGQDARHRLIPITHADRWVLRLQIHYLEFIGSTGFNVYPRQAGVILGGVGPAGGQASGNVYPYTAGGIIGQVG